MNSNPQTQTETSKLQNLVEEMSESLNRFEKRKIARAVLDYQEHPSLEVTN